MTTLNALNASDELQQNEIVEFTNYWNDDNHLIAYTNDRLNLWSSIYTVALMDKLNKIVIKCQLPETRNCFGIMTCPDKNIFIYVHCNYIDDNASIVIEIYNIIDGKINLLREFIIPSNTWCGMTTGVLQRIGMYNFNVIWGDLVNYEYVNSVAFNLDEYTPTRIINDIYIDDDGINDIADYYFITNDIIIKSDVIAINGNTLYIRIRNCKTDSIIYIQDVELPYTHKYDENEVESSILEFAIYNKRALCLVRVRLEDKIDVLHIERYALDILMDIDNNSIISISQKIKNDNYEVKSSIYFIDDTPLICCF